MTEEGEIEVPVWYKNGGMWIRRECLEPEHPESTYNYIKNTLGLDPEDYGYYFHQLSEEQEKLLWTIPDEVLDREIRRRERKIYEEETFG